MLVGVVDLGRTGASIVRRLLASGHRCVVYDRSPRLVAELAAERAHGASSLADLANELDAPRAIWLAGPPALVDATLAELVPHLEAGDTVVDCTDSYYVDDVRRAADLGASGIYYLDVGLSGAIGGPAKGFCLTIGGEAAAVGQLDPIFRDLALSPSERGGGAGASTARSGYLHCGPAGAGHFVNMIHDGVGYCLMAACAEAFGILGAATDRYEFNLTEIAEVWRHGSAVASPVLDLTARALSRNPGFHRFSPRMAVDREHWRALKAAVDEAVSTPVLASAIFTAMGRDDAEFSTGLLAAVEREYRGAVESIGR